MASRDCTEEQFRVLFDAAPNGVMAVDAAGCIIMLNAQVEKMFGYSRKELIGQPVDVLIPERFRHEHACQRKKFAAVPQMRPMGIGRDLVGARKGGGEFAVEVGLNPTATSMGDVVIATVVDITERQRAAAEEKLRERVQLCQQLGMPAAVLQHNGQILLMNALFEKLHSQFVFRVDRIESAAPMGNEFLRQELARLNTRNDGKIVDPTPIPAGDGYPALIFHRLPMKDSVGGTLGILVVPTLTATGMVSSNLLQSLFALTSAEARVAALIGSGLSPRKTAEKLGISEGNARTTLKRVFSRLQVQRQSELAVLLTKLASLRIGSPEANANRFFCMTLPNGR